MERGKARGESIWPAVRSTLPPARTIVSCLRTAPSPGIDEAAAGNKGQAGRSCRTCCAPLEATRTSGYRRGARTKHPPPSKVSAASANVWPCDRTTFQRREGTASAHHLSGRSAAGGPTSRPGWLSQGPQHGVREPRHHRELQWKPPSAPLGLPGMGRELVPPMAVLAHPGTPVIVRLPASPTSPIN